MIREGEKPKDVSTALGYEVYSTFYRNYIKVIGFAPTDRSSEYQLLPSDY